MPVALPPIVYVMGPSGAGKDSLLRFARINLGPSDRIAFAHRYITRPPDVAGENHIALTREEFELRRAADLFALHWSAHDTLYGIGLEIDAWRQQGLLVIINGSRQHFATLPADPATIIPVLVTATPNILAARLAGRGRESTTEVLARLRRKPETTPEPSMIEIDNSGPLEIAGQRLIGVLRSLARSKQDRRLAGYQAPDNGNRARI